MPEKNKKSKKAVNEKDEKNIEDIEEQENQDVDKSEILLEEGAEDETINEEQELEGEEEEKEEYEYELVAEEEILKGIEEEEGVQEIELEECFEEIEEESEGIHILSELSGEPPVEEEEEIFVYEPWMEKELGIFHEPKGEEYLEEELPTYPKYILSETEIIEEEEAEEGEEEEIGEEVEPEVEVEEEQIEEIKEAEAEEQPIEEEIREEHLEEEEEIKEEIEEEEEFYDYEHEYYWPYGKNYVPITLDLIKQTIKMLCKIELCWPKIDIPKKKIPKSYFTCTNKEKILLWYTENFRQQFHLIYKDRKPLMLAPENEYGIQKMICTTIQPTTLRYSEFQNWNGIAKFLSDFMILLSLEKPLDLPSVIRSPTLLLRRQEANCFELSMLLCSYLIGHRYDAYVVSGYASRELCLQDQSLTECPYKLEKTKEEKDIVEKTKNKYTVKPAPDLKSQYQKEMKRRERESKREIRRQQIEEDKRIIQMLEKPPIDELMGLRVHSWVLVLPNEARSEITEGFFIESTTGCSYPLDHFEYYGIESLWNNYNYWVNIQDCSQGIKGLSYNLMDTTKWEHLLPGEPFRSREPDFISKTEASMLTYQEKHLDMPQSWVPRLNLGHKQYELLYPQGGRVFYYKKCTLEKYAPYVMPDGLVLKLTNYDDYERTDPIYILQEYIFRKDRLTSLKIDLDLDTCIKCYGRGREDSLKENERPYSMTKLRIDSIYRFYTRLDCLRELKYYKNTLTELFENRDDFLISRVTYFFAEDTSHKPLSTKGPFHARKVQKVVEKFKRNPKKMASEDIAYRYFIVPEDQISLVFHYEPGRVSARTRTFTKPPISDTGKRLTFSANLTTGYLPEARDPQPSQMFLYHLMKEQMDCEEETLYHIRETEKWMITLGETLEHEQRDPILITNIFNKNQNKEAYEAFSKMQKEMMELSKREVETDIDFLSPFLAAFDNPEELSAKNKMDLKVSCLDNFKKTAVERANLLQAKFNCGAALLESRQQWFEDHQDTLTDAEMKEYFDFVNSLQFNMSLLQSRLKRHQINTSAKFNILENWLENDPRLQMDKKFMLDPKHKDPVRSESVSTYS